MVLEPLNDKIVVRPMDENETWDGRVIKKKEGQLIVQAVVEKDRPTVGTILAVSAEAKLKVNDIVAFGRYAGVEFCLNDETVLIMSEDDLLGVIREI